MHPGLDTANSAGALLATLAIVTALPPVLVTVTLLAALVVPTVWVPNETVGAIVNTPGVGVIVPVPDALMTWGLPTPLLVTVIVAARAPAAAGANVTLIVHVAPALTVVQPALDTANSAGTLLTMLETVTAVPPVLVTTMLLGALVVPTVCIANVNVVAIVN